MQERSRKLRTALLVPLFGLAAGLAAAQVATSGNAGAATPGPRPASTNRGAGTARPSSSFLGTRSGPTTLPSLSGGGGGTIGSTTARSSAASRMVTPSLAMPPGPASGGTNTAARTDGQLDCPTLAGIAVFADCTGRP